MLPAVPVGFDVRIDGGVSRWFDDVRQYHYGYGCCTYVVIA